jgi:[acyl-carrier-protein] S-malonyltransferase
MKIAMVFPGYGSQFVGMAKELYDESRLIQEYFEEASNCLNINFVKLCFASSEIELAKMDYAYESIFLVSSAIAALLEQENIKPDIVAGFGVGEYSAICATGGLNLPDGLYFLSKYAQFYQELLSTISVRAIKVQGLAYSKVQKICASLATEQNYVSVAVRLTEHETIVAGIIAAVGQVEELVIAQEAKVMEMPVEMGLHSPLMMPVVDHLGVYLEKIDFKDLNVPLLESLDGKTVKAGDAIKHYSMKKIHHMIKWNKVVQALEDFDIIIQVGPGTKIVKNLIIRYPEKQILAINKPTDIDAIKKILIPSKPVLENQL